MRRNGTFGKRFDPYQRVGYRWELLADVVDPTDLRAGPSETYLEAWGAPGTTYWTEEAVEALKREGRPELSHNFATIESLYDAVFEALKPGGIFYVEDHSAAPGAGLEAASKVHRMDEAIAKTELMTAGFKLDGEGSLLRNTADNRVAGNSETVRFATDRFMLRMKRP